jgi:hypothetical protein
MAAFALYSRFEIRGGLVLPGILGKIKDAILRRFVAKTAPKSSEGSSHDVEIVGADSASKPGDAGAALVKKWEEENAAHDRPTILLCGATGAGKTSLPAPSSAKSSSATIS